MNYERLNLRKNDVWKAEYVKHIEDAIAALAAGGSGGGVSSWNDLTDKPFYYINGWVPTVENVSMPSSLVTMMGITVLGNMYITTEDVANFFATVGRECKFIIDGNEYVCTCKWVEGNGMSGLAYGNTDAFLGTGNTGEPFIMIPGCDETTGQRICFLLIIYIMDTQPTDHTCSLYTHHEELKKLDSIYLPEGAGLPEASSADNGKVLTVGADGTAAWNDPVVALPEVSVADDGKFLRVVNGGWSVTTVRNAEEVSF